MCMVFRTAIAGTTQTALWKKNTEYFQSHITWLHFCCFSNKQRKRLDDKKLLFIGDLMRHAGQARYCYWKNRTLLTAAGQEYGNWQNRRGEQNSICKMCIFLFFTFKLSNNRLNHWWLRCRSRCVFLVILLSCDLLRVKLARYRLGFKLSRSVVRAKCSCCCSNVCCYCILKW